MGERQIRVMTVDDHPLMTAGITSEINSQSDMTVVAQASDGKAAIELFRTHRPDVTLMDLRMPHVGGLEAITAIRSEFSRARIVVLTTWAGDIKVLSAFKAGAVGYLLKDTLRTELIDTIRGVHMGERRIPPEIALQLAQHAADDALTPRELDVLRGLAQGSPNKLIACDLSIAEHTVKNHIKNILSKLDANDRTGAVIIAARRGYIDL
ncbi:Response regulators consisting of a CheY-like receiver domain and a HTH DNA-binding domain [Acidisarcina polymorpha]|uniref:Response regulators consisting of a CheY-like receiver domain and a HTH DNA-binding domain n=1 Tax=Acidisarcina polymorpha TaxID=2211140 RepID=A0A2Z5FU69_9BACT|nr:response regulator transcription factor [Acidisarcina polymorpha]AXC10026.1 Response regulators consisting of a CheY-like receiver domain and a HTH DNA-binding domain [Acidisarcina polymorpha]